MKSQSREQIARKAKTLLGWLDNGDINISEYMRAKEKLDKIPFEKSTYCQSRITDEDIEELLYGDTDAE